jgi:outer membrane protein TolC
MAGVFAVSQAGAQGPLKLGDLIEQAERNNLSLAEGRAQREQAEADVTLSRSEFLPKLLVESSASYVSSGETWGSSGALVLRQNLYDGGQSWSNFWRSRIVRERAELLERGALETMSLEVLKAWVNCSRLERNRASTRRKLELLEVQVDSARRQYRQGRKTQRDYQLLVAELERSRLRVASLEDATFQAYRDLEKAVGSSQISFDAKSIELLTVDRVLALKNWAASERGFSPDQESLELRALKLGVEDTELALSQTRRSYWPVLSANASASYGSSSFVGPGATPWSENDGTQLGVGLQLSWTLWDFGGTPARVAQARVARSLAEKRYAQKKLDLENDHKVLARGLERQAKALDLQKKIRDLERASFADIERSYREGLSTYLELITALDRDVAAEQGFEDEVFSYFVSLAQLMQLKGALHAQAQTF